MRILITDSENHPVPVEEFTELDRDCIALMQKHNLRFLQHNRGQLISNATFEFQGTPAAFILQEKPGFTIDV